MPEEIPLRSSRSDDEEEYLLQYSIDKKEAMEESQRNGRRGGLGRFWRQIWRFITCQRDPKYHSRSISVGQEVKGSFPKNRIKNQKYNVITFVPLVLFQQFKFFLNLYFLIMACSQFIPGIRIGYLYTYWGPLCFVLLVTMIREAVDDYRRWRRDSEINSMKYQKLTRTGRVTVTSMKIKVGDLIVVEKDQRLPADMVLLRTSEKTGSCFIRTDQLDGETDWKLRLAVVSTQALESEEGLFGISGHVYAEKPQRDIHSFIGTFSQSFPTATEEPLTIENTLWCNTVVASGTAVGLVIYTGRETRSAMNNSEPRSKVGLLDLEVNQLTKVLFGAVVALAALMLCLKGFEGPWYRYMFRFVLLFSYLIPISLRVNLDMGKAFYTWTIQRDKKIPETVVRSTTIAEELGRISYLLSDKTGTLTQNVMHFRKLHLGTVSYSNETFDEVSSLLHQHYSQPTTPVHAHSLATKMRRTVVTRVADAVKAIALCHNVTPVYEDSDDDVIVDIYSEAEDDQHSTQSVTYQASSPDEVALVTWTESVGVALVSRDLTSIVLRDPSGRTERFTILQVFPFTSETKRMGIILRDESSGEITLYMKGADTVMSKLVEYNDWLEEECGNMAREGLRTLVVAKRGLTQDEYNDFEAKYNAAKMAVVDRNARQGSVVETLERNLELLCLTGVEDKLQENVRSTLELLRNAGIKVWMLTGDKLETATCIAKSSRLISRTQTVHTFADVQTRAEAHQELNAFRRKQDCALVIKGESLEVCLQHYELEFLELASAAPSVVCCRCSPTQKALIVKLIQRYTGKRTAAIGDGGNDVSMIQAADAGIGIVGKEGRQAALAADFALTQFSHIGRLLLVHGRRSYKRSAALSQFVIHRGLIISTMQAIFSAIFYFASVALYQGFLMVGFSTVYTMLPVFSLVLDKDVTSSVAMTYPEIYRELSKGRSLSFKTFFIWVLISIYQGGVIMYGALILFEEELIHIVAISFSALIITELIMVSLAAKSFHPLMLGAELISFLLYVASLVIFKESFDVNFIQSTAFLWKVLVITVVSCVPLYILKFLHAKFAPPSYTKLT